MPHCKDITIVARISEPGSMARIKTRQAGMDGFISTPCTQAELIEALTPAMKLAAQRRCLNPMRSILRNQTVLIVDDESVNRQIIEPQRNSWGLQTLHTNSGQMALDTLTWTGRLPSQSTNRPCSRC